MVGISTCLWEHFWTKVGFVLWAWVLNIETMVLCVVGLKRLTRACAAHCESGEELWLQGEAALQVHSFRDSDPQPVIPPNEKKNHGMSVIQLRPGMNISLTASDPCLPSTA